MSSSELYELNGVKSLVAGERTILDIERLAIPEGELTAVVGPNGAGKSTLLQLLAFLGKPSEGEIYFRGRKVEAKGFFRLRRLVTMVDQTPLLFSGSVFKNVAYGLKVRDVPDEEWEVRAREALSMVDLAGFENRSVKGLSGGETQRVAIARALAFRPEVVLLDEPTAGVDASRVEMVESLIREINTSMRTSIIFSTHNHAQAHRLTDCVIHMSAGRTVDKSTENVFSGHVEIHNGLRFVSLRSGAKVAISEPKSGLVKFSIPSSCIEIEQATGGKESINRFEGAVTRMEIRGDKVRLRIDSDISLRVEMNPEKLERKGITLGSRVAVSFPPEEVHILD